MKIAARWTRILNRVSCLLLGHRQEYDRELTRSGILWVSRCRWCGRQRVHNRTDADGSLSWDKEWEALEREGQNIDRSSLPK